MRGRLSGILTKLMYAESLLNKSESQINLKEQAKDNPSAQIADSTKSNSATEVKNDD